MSRVEDDSDDSDQVLFTLHWPPRPAGVIRNETPPSRTSDDTRQHAQPRCRGPASEPALAKGKARRASPTGIVVVAGSVGAAPAPLVQTALSFAHRAAARRGPGARRHRHLAAGPRGGQAILPRTVFISVSENARRVCVRALPRAPALMDNAAIDISSRASTTTTTSYWPRVQNISFTVTLCALAINLKSSARARPLHRP